MKTLSKYSDYLVYLSLVGLVIATYSAFSGKDLWLAPTQWILVSGAIVTYAVYLKLSK
ncbi:MAG: hypothetical protein PHT36_03175 [Patescibacteria group bacterium]|nr:hypothetical protein [Patescibacteria group bacterium]